MTPKTFEQERDEAAEALWPYEPNMGDCNESFKAGADWAHTRAEIETANAKLAADCAFAEAELQQANAQAAGSRAETKLAMEIVETIKTRLTAANELIEKLERALHACGEEDCVIAERAGAYEALAAIEEFKKG